MTDAEFILLQVIIWMAAGRFGWSLSAWLSN